MKMLSEGISPIGNGILDISEERLKGLIVPDDINAIYELEETPFARGKFAAVRRAVHKKSGQHFAAKFLKRRKRAQSSDKEIRHEIAVLMLCNDSDNIVKLNAVHETRSDTALLLELATGGELQTFLDNEECLSETQARICMREVLKGLQYLHKRSIAHLDLKPQNILLAGERIEDGLKLCDFGISRNIVNGTNVREILGTPDYVAPEVLQYEPLSLLTDIWSAGVLSYVLLSGFSPFAGESKQETFLNISQCSLTFPSKLFGGVSSAAIDFICKALRVKPNDRISATGCLNHIWLKDECNIERHVFNEIAVHKLKYNHNYNEVDVDEEAVKPMGIVNIEESTNSLKPRLNSNLQQSNDDAKMVTGVLQITGYISDYTEQLSNSYLDGYIYSHTNDRHGSKVAPNGLYSKNILEKVTDKYPSISKTTTVNRTVCNNSVSNGAALYGVQKSDKYRSYITDKRNLSENNKENSVLAIRKELTSATTLTTAVAANKKPTKVCHSGRSALSISADGSSVEHNTVNCADYSSKVASIIASGQLPNRIKDVKWDGIFRSSSASSQFPNAPTTPKVIRNTSSNGTYSSTSVKDLVKKFQQEQGTQQMNSIKGCTVGDKQSCGHLTSTALCQRSSAKRMVSR